jgi:hypothetical protein
MRKKLTEKDVETLLTESAQWQPKTEMSEGLAHAALTKQSRTRPRIFWRPVFALCATGGLMLWFTLKTPTAPFVAIPEKHEQREMREQIVAIAPLKMPVPDANKPVDKTLKTQQSRETQETPMRKKTHHRVRNATRRMSFISHISPVSSVSRRQRTHRRPRSTEPIPTLWTTDTVTREEKHLVSPVVVASGDASNRLEYIPAVMTTPLSEENAQ